MVRREADVLANLVLGAGWCLANLVLVLSVLTVLVLLGSAMLRSAMLRSVLLVLRRLSEAQQGKAQ